MDMGRRNGEARTAPSAEGVPERPVAGDSRVHPCFDRADGPRTCRAKCLVTAHKPAPGMAQKEGVRGHPGSELHVGSNLCKVF